MSPREIEVHIEELVLHGFDPHARWEIGDTVADELRELLTSKGIPAAWLSSPERINAGVMPLTKPAMPGAGIAGAAYRGGAK